MAVPLFVCREGYKWKSMNLERYEYTAQKSFLIFEFISEGPNGSILKVILFEEMAVKGFYNLALGDKDLDTGRINDLSVSNNGDSVKILATVVASLYEFTNHYPHAWITATGSTLSRTGFIRWVYRNICLMFKKTSYCMALLMKDGKCLKNRSITKGFWLKEKLSKFAIWRLRN